MCLPTKMKSLRILSSFLCLTVLDAVKGGYISDLGLPSDALDFTPKDTNSNEFDFTPVEYQNKNRRGDYEEHHQPDHEEHHQSEHEEHHQSDHEEKLPAPTSYASFKLESKDPVPVTIKIWKPHKSQLEWPKSPIWLEQESSNDHGSSEGHGYEAPSLMHHPSPPSDHMSYSEQEEEGGHPTALARHPPSPQPHAGYSAPHSAPQSYGPPENTWQPAQPYQPDQGYNYELMDRQSHHRR